MNILGLTSRPRGIYATTLVALIPITSKKGGRREGDLLLTLPMMLSQLCTEEEDGMPLSISHFLVSSSPQYICLPPIFTLSISFFLSVFHFSSNYSFLSLSYSLPHFFFLGLFFMTYLSTQSPTFCSINQ